MCISREAHDLWIRPGALKDYAMSHPGADREHKGILWINSSVYIFHRAPINRL